MGGGYIDSSDRSSEPLMTMESGHYHCAGDGVAAEGQQGAHSGTHGSQPGVVTQPRATERDGEAQRVAQGPLQ